MTGGWRHVEKLLDDAIRQCVFPSASLLVGSADQVVYERYAGGVGPEAASPDSVYDVSSLTKPLATVALLMRLVERGKVLLDRPLIDDIPDFGARDAPRATVTVRDLLTHRSGLPAHRRYFELLSDEQRRTGRKLAGTQAGALRVHALAAAEPLERAPRTEAVYSDVGFILLGRLVEIAGGSALDSMFHDQIAGPLALESTGFVGLDAPAPAFARRAMPCGECGWRQRPVRGEVQDENAWAMGGVAGHAGLFSRAREVHRMVVEHERALRGLDSIYDSDTLATFWTRDEDTPGSTWALGWDTPSVRDSSAGSLIGRPAFGHLGFTGTSVWVDVERGVHVVLLTNRLVVGRDNARIRALRPRLHDAVFSSLDGGARPK